MLKEKMIKKDDPRWEKPEGLETQYGTCKFCGQMARIEALFPWTEEDCNECATELCTCPQSITYTSRKKRKEEGAEKIKQKFGDGAGELRQSEEIQQLLNDALALVAEEEVNKVSVNIDGMVKADINLTSKGSIKVSRTVTKKDSSEV